jgi:hypothetical protein
MKLRVIKRNVVNFHKDNWKEIIYALSLSFLYAFCSMALVSIISLRHDWSVLVAMTVYYPLLRTFAARPDYKTLYGKVSANIALICGGFLGYLNSQYIVDLVSNLI